MDATTPLPYFVDDMVPLRQEAEEGHFGLFALLDPLGKHQLQWAHVRSCSLRAALASHVHYLAESLPDVPHPRARRLPDGIKCHMKWRGANGCVHDGSSP